ncbi:uncharacterized protein PRCAT00000312001 [Priceomyces carsonii]|uniref:uncharacterized protein n=1 Tax=Priceomyces carsonii TaxID=28549 RepID=UPI002EDB08B5|nr:unnamed protein product [Priceomyces carsonii]
MYKGKILFLHGFTQSSSIFYAKTSGLRKRLAKLGYKSIYLNGPIKISPAAIPSNDSLEKFESNIGPEESDTDHRAWWLRSNFVKDPLDLSLAIDTIKEYILNNTIISDPDLAQEESEEEKNLPIVGIVGFSQGAALGGIICLKFDKIFDTNPLQFAILYSGFKIDSYEALGNLKFYPTESESAPHVLHVYGELDTVVDENRVLPLYNAMKSTSDLLKHPGGHFVPNSKIYVENVSNWIQNMTKESKENKSDDDLDKLGDIIDSIGKA